MPNFFRSFFRVRAAKLCSGLALTGLSLLAFAPTAFAGTSTLDTYLEQHPDEIPFWIEAGLLSKGVTSAIGPSAGQIAGQAGNTGVGIVFPDETGRLSRVQGYSPSEIQKGLQRLADRYCNQNPVDCYGVGAYYYSVVIPGSVNPFISFPEEGFKIVGPIPECEVDLLSFVPYLELVASSTISDKNLRKAGKNIANSRGKNIIFFQVLPKNDQLENMLCLRVSLSLQPTHYGRNMEENIFTITQLIDKRHIYSFTTSIKEFFAQSVRSAA